MQRSVMSRCHKRSLAYKTESHHMQCIYGFGGPEMGGKGQSDITGESPLSLVDETAPAASASGPSQLMQQVMKSFP